MQKKLCRTNESIKVGPKVCTLSAFLVYWGSVDPVLDKSNNISAASLVEMSMSGTAAETELLLWVLLPELTALSISIVSIFETLVNGGSSFTVRPRGSTGCGSGTLPVLQKVNELKKRRFTGFCSEHKSPLKRNIWRKMSAHTNRS